VFTLLERRAAQLPHIRLIYNDPCSECRAEPHTFGSLSLRVRPLLQGNVERLQLCAPVHHAEASDELSDCRLYSIVVRDQASSAGNDYRGGARMTDLGVRAAASDLMRAITKVEGRYDAVNNSYHPPSP
jgi:hypothetical protein